MKKWFIGVALFAGLFWGAHVMDNRPAPASVASIQVPDPRADVQEPVEPVPPVANAPLPPSKPVAKRKGAPVPKPPARPAAPYQGHVSMPEPLPPAPVVFRCYVFLECVRT